MLKNRVGIVALLAAALVGSTTAGAQAQPAKKDGGNVALNRKGIMLREGMRKLWSDHVLWTRNYIVAAVADDPSASAAAARLLKNQEDLGNAIVPYYGSAAGSRLTALLKDHITIAVDLVSAAKAGDNAKVSDADKRWHQNAVDIATFLSGANRHWPRRVPGHDAERAPEVDDRGGNGAHPEALDGRRRDLRQDLRPGDAHG